MAPLTDPTRLEAFKDALSNWRHGGYIQFELNETARRWIDHEFQNIIDKDIGRFMHEEIEKGGVIHEVEETRSNWSDHEYHYDLRFKINNKPIYIECRLEYEIPFQPDVSIIIVVNIHAP